MGNEFQYHFVRSNKVIRLWWENYLLKAQTIATDQISSLRELPFEPAKIPSLSCSLRNGGSASAPKGSEQFFSSWGPHWASEMAEEQVQRWTLPFTFSPPGLPTPQALPPWWGAQGPIPRIHNCALRQWLICFALQSSAWNSPKQGTGASTMSGKWFSLTHFLQVQS